jgi:hypothetical protein
MKKSFLFTYFTFITIFSFGQKKYLHSSFDTSKVVGFISLDSSYSNIKSFRGYVVIYNPSDKELDTYKDGSHIRIFKIPEQVILDEQKHKLLYTIITWYFAEWKDIQ